MIDIVKKYSGKGMFNFDLEDEINLELEFTLKQYSNAKIEIEAHLNQISPDIVELMNKFQEERIILVSVDGTIDKPEGTVKIEESYLNTIGLDFKKDEYFLFKFVLKVFKSIEIIFNKDINPEKITVYAGLTNFIFRGCKTIIKGLDGFNTEISGLNLNFIHNEDYNEKIKALKENKKKVVITSEVTTVLPKDKENVFTNIIIQLTDLLSYASRNRISHIYEDYYDDNDLLYKTVLRPVFTREFNKENDLIDTENFADCDLKNFLEICYHHYDGNLNKFGLNIHIAFYLEAFSQKYSDLSFLLFTTALETILTGYEEICEEEGNPLSKGMLKRNKKETIKILKKFEVEDYEEISDRIVEKISYPHPTLNDKLTAFSKDERFSIELNTFDRDFIQIRNKIAHTGKFPRTINSNGEERSISMGTERDRLIYLLDRVVLTILGYKGNLFINKLDYKKELL